MSRCPVCQCERFYIPDPQDEYETHGFELNAGRVSFASIEVDADAPAVTAGTEVFCDRCSWHGPGRSLGIADGSS